MQRHATTLTTIVAIAAASSVTLALAADAPTPRAVQWLNGGALSGDASESLAALNADATFAFAADAAPSGFARVIHGGRIAFDRANPDAAARALLARHGRVFGFDEALEPIVTTPAGGRVHVRFSADGTEVTGVALRLVLDGDALVAAAAERPGPAVRVGAFTLDSAAAITRARTHLAAERARIGRGGSPEFGTQAGATLLATADGLVAAWRVELTAPAAGEAWSVIVAGDDGAPLEVMELVRRGTGVYPLLNGQGVLFKTTKGVGRVFKSVDHAIGGVTKKVTLQDWAKGVPAPVDVSKGLLISAHADVWDANAADPFEPSGEFLFDPFFSEQTADAFDAANMMHQIETFYRFLEKNLGPRASDLAIPIIVNFETNVPNAFFSPTTFPIDGHTVGYMQFHDLKPFLDVTADFARDASVIAHEYVHAMLAFEGLGFNDTLDFPTRAVGEAIPDFFAVTYHDDHVIGRYLDAAFGPGFSRDLQDDDVFPDTTVDAMTLTVSGLPEEHRNGEIFGAMLVDLREALGDETAMQRVFSSIPLMPANMAAVGFPTYDINNAVEGTGVYFGLCAFALLQSDTKGKHVGEVIGAATTRGIYGSAASEILVAVNLEALSKRKESFPARFLGGANTHAYVFRAQQGRKLKVKIVGDKGSGLLPDFTITDDQGNPAAVTHTKAKTVSADGRTVSEKGILLKLPLTADPDVSDPFYVITISSPSFTSGRYVLTLDA